MMKKLLFFFLTLSYLSVHSQQLVTVNDLINITSLADKKLSAYMTKMSFVQTARNIDDGAVIMEFFYNNKKNPSDTTMRFVSGYRRGKVTGAIFQTSSFEEFQYMLRQFRMNGFIGGSAKQDSLMRMDSTRMDS